ncbi:DUF2971 domain-containing protein (plasmid) [Ralstonia solanacearum]|nr:DUF2971 domain-containing protein [Ralstonia pseudosolanacearum]MCK4145523.1 DUF2971 domain-containing protein [Ralstonia pseudosolanacearum]QWF64611.1 DUF2971 domain-containing protein [Ralstonia solanacearum]
MRDTDVLWRYMPLDRFINLVDTSSLFFAPLAWYEKSDPFEGYLPRVAMESLASISAETVRIATAQIDAVQKIVPPNVSVQELDQLRQIALEHSSQMRSLYKNIVSCLMVSCWYRSEHESEGMWGLYSKEGIAIKTSVAAIKAALDGNQQDHVIHIGAIKYLDFTSTDLTPSDCVTQDGHLIGMIKRVAYAHENEVRMCITRPRELGSMEDLKPAPTSVSVNVEKLIEAVVISPFAGTSLRQSIQTVCRWGGIEARKVSTSNLLENCEHLLDVYN